MERSAIYIDEKKEKIDKIRKKYNNVLLEAKQAEKIIKLESTNEILTTATKIVGILTVINWIIPDTLPIIDEAILTGIATLLGTSSKIVENNIDSIAETGSSQVKIEEIEKLINKAGQIVSNIKSKRTK